MRNYLVAFRGLLAGETVTWEGAPMRMPHPPTAAGVPVRIPILVGAVGPKGLQVARDLGDGLFAATIVPEASPDFPEVAFLAFGTVLDEGEPVDSARVRSSAGPAVAQTYHTTYEYFRDQVTALPGGREWLDVVEAVETDERHLAVHVGHCLELNQADRAAWDAGAHTLVGLSTLSGTAAEVLRKARELADQGVTELVYQPAGDIPAELDRFHQAVRHLG